MLLQYGLACRDEWYKRVVVIDGLPLLVAQCLYVFVWLEHNLLHVVSLTFVERVRELHCAGIRVCHRQPAPIVRSCELLRHYEHKCVAVALFIAYRLPIQLRQ